MVKPTAKQVHEYMISKGHDDYDEAEAFIDHFETVGWLVGKSRTPMKKWKNAVNTWLRNNRRWRDEGSKPNNSFADRLREQASQAFAELEAMEQRNGEASNFTVHETGGYIPKQVQNSRH